MVASRPWINGHGYGGLWGVLYKMPMSTLFLARNFFFFSNPNEGGADPEEGTSTLISRRTRGFCQLAPSLDSVDVSRLLVLKSSEKDPISMLRGSRSPHHVKHRRIGEVRCSIEWLCYSGSRRQSWYKDTTKRTTKKMYCALARTLYMMFLLEARPN